MVSISAGICLGWQGFVFTRIANSTVNLTGQNQTGPRLLASTRESAFIQRSLAIWGLALFVVLYTPLVDWFARTLKIADVAGQASAIVVLAAWASPSGELNESGLRRSLLAAELYRDGIADVVVVTGGQPVDAGTGSAVSAMAQLIRLVGVPEEAIVRDTASANTHASAANIAVLAGSRGWSQVVLVTDAMHMYRSLLAFKKAGLVALPRSTLLWDLGGGEDPTIRLRNVSSIAHEYVGLLYYWWRGWV